jgi:hypothetical protein
MSRMRDMGPRVILLLAALGWQGCSACGSERWNVDFKTDGLDGIEHVDGQDGEFVLPDGETPFEMPDGWPDGTDGTDGADPVIERVCTPGEGECIDLHSRRFCNEDGTGWEEETCHEGFVCQEENGRCIIRLCVPGNRYCVDAATWQVCNGEGTGYDPGGSCAAAETCMGGECYDPCDLAEAMRYSIGCVYYAVDTNPMHSFVPGDYAVALSNTHATSTANVVIERKDGGVWNPVGTYSIAPLGLQTVVLAHRYIDGSALYPGGAYRITSDLPIIAYQFNPLDGSSSFLSDASLLLPRSGLDTYHIVSHFPQGPADQTTTTGWPAHIQIAASAPTNLTVTSSIATTAGSGVPALSPGIPQAFTLDEGDYLQLTVANFMDSFTGTYIESDQPVAVFAANDCTNVPADLNYCCCEHLEEQLFGLQTWGTTYVGSMVPRRGTEPAVWHIVGSVDGTTINFNYSPDITGLPATATVNRGQRLEYQVGGSAANPGDFYVSADQPIHVTQYMVAAFMVAYMSGSGDPSMVQAVPVDQFLDRYVILVPGTWVNDYLVLTRHTGSTINIDGVPVSSAWVPAGTSPYEVTRASVSDGVHVVDGDQPFGVLVVGYDEYDSYAYPGGLNLQIINPM